MSKKSKKAKRDTGLPEALRVIHSEEPNPHDG